MRSTAFVLVPLLLAALWSEAVPHFGTGSGQAAPTPLETLGRYLFFDTRLSGDGSLSCASCHQPEYAFAGSDALSAAYPGSDGFRNTPSLIRVGARGSYFADGRLPASDLETAVRDAITETHFMNLDGRLMQERLKQVPRYVELFQEAFGEATAEGAGAAAEPTFGRTLAAVAAFVKTLDYGRSPYESGTMSEAAVRGEALFRGKAGCTSCHVGPAFSDNRAHVTDVPESEALFAEPLRHATYRAFIKAMGVPNYMTVRRDVGRYTVTKNEADRGAFVTPTLVGARHTPPYMHNGVLETLNDVVDFYDRVGGGVGSPGGNGGARAQDARSPLGLTQAEKQDLVAFLEALSGDMPVVERPELPRYEVIRNWNTTDN